MCTYTYVLFVRHKAIIIIGTLFTRWQSGISNNSNSNITFLILFLNGISPNHEHHDSYDTESESPLFVSTITVLTSQLASWQRVRVKTKFLDFFFLPHSPPCKQKMDLTFFFFSSFFFFSLQSPKKNKPSTPPTNQPTNQPTYTFLLTYLSYFKS